MVHFLDSSFSTRTEELEPLFFVQVTIQLEW